MPDTGLLKEKREEIETHIVQELDGRDALIDLEVFITGQWRRGYITDAEKNELLNSADLARLAIRRGLDYTRKVRGKPEEYYT